MAKPKKEYEKLSLAEKWHYINARVEEIDRKVRRLINHEEKK